MALLRKLDDLKGNTSVLLLLDVLFLILPGVAAIFLLNRELFMQLDWAKLVLLSGSLSAPFTFFNAALLPDLEGPQDASKKDYTNFYQLSFSILLTGFAVYIVIALLYFFPKNFQLSNIWIPVLLVESGIALILWWSRNNKLD